MRDTKAGLIWITDILKNHEIPFQITGGLAAKVYGSTRPLDDIDIDIPENSFELIVNDVQPYIVYGPGRFKSEKWDLLLMTLKYKGQAIDLSGAYETRIFNEKTQHWHELHEDLTKVTIMNVMGMDLPVIPKEQLLAYKQILAREVDLMDVKLILTNLSI